MIRSLTIGVVSSLLLGLPGSAQEAEIAWHETLASARTAAKSSGKPVFALFRCEP